MIGRDRFGSSTGPQKIMLGLLDDGATEDSVGLEAEELNSYQIAVCERLVGRDLVRFDIGWRYSCWFRLTPEGRDALEQLRAASQTS